MVHDAVTLPSFYVLLHQCALTSLFELGYGRFSCMHLLSRHRENRESAHALGGGMLSLEQADRRCAPKAVFVSPCIDLVLTSLSHQYFMTLFLSA